MSFYVFLDISRVFNTTDDNVLLGKLSNYGSRGIAFNWFKS